jgi:sensor histidine kinase YesM
VPLIIPSDRFSQIKNSQIYDIVEFEKAIYIATNKGLFQYDGHELYTFSQKNGLKDDEVFNFQIHDGKLWFNSILGKLYTLSPQKKHIEQFTLFDDYIKSFFWFQNTLYYTTNKSELCAWNATIGKKLIETIPNVLAYKIKNNLLFLLHTQFEFSVLDIHTQRLIKKPDILTDNRYSVPIRNRNNLNSQLYIFYQHRLGVIPSQEEKIQEVISLEKQAVIYAIYPNPELILIGTREGLYQLENNKTTCILPNIFVTNIIKDSEGTYWITTFNGEIFIIPDIDIRTKTTELKMKSQLRKLCLFQNNVIYGTNTGEVFFNHRLIPDIKKNYEAGKLNQIMSITSDNQNVYIARDDGFFICNPNQRKTEYISTVYTIKKLSSEHPSYYIIGAYYKVVMIDKKTKKIIKSYPCPRIADLAVWHNNIPLICTYNQVFCIKNDSIEEIMKNEYLNRRIRFCHYDKEKKELFISHQLGVDVYDSNLKVIKKINLHQSYRLNKIQTYQNSIYIASQEGLLVIYKNNVNQIIHAQNLYGLNLYDIAIQNDTLHFISDAGYGHIPLNKLNFEKPSFTNDYQLITDEKFLNNKRITIKYPQNALQLAVIPKTLKYKSKVHYEYKFIGDSVIQRSNYPLLSIPLVRSGVYKIKVATLIGKNIIHEDIFEVEFILPIWKDKNFKIFLIVLLFAGAALLYMEYIIRKQKQRTYVQKQQNASLKYQLQAVQSRLNPHFIFNGLQSLQYLVVSNQNLLAKKYLNNFASLTRQFLNYSQHEFCSIEDEIAILENYLNLENIAHQNKVQHSFTIKVEDDIILNQRIIPSLILQPLVENIFKHAFPEDYPNPKIEIRFIENIQKHNLTIEIEDNGIGMPIDILPNSKGLQLIYQRLEIINKTYNTHHNIEIYPSKKFDTGTLCYLSLQFKSL